MLTSHICKYLPETLKRELQEKNEFEWAEELRLRAGKPAMFYALNREFILSTVVDREGIGDILYALSEHSLHSFMDELRQGFFTIDQGIRIGIAGKVVSEKGSIRMIRNFSSLNVRFPREMKGVQRKLMPYIANDRQICNVLILSAPQHGKTTLLRDIVRAVSSGEGYTPKKCTVVDERSEIAGGTYFDLGDRTDILTSCPKSEGLIMALRSLSPEVLATDEIGNETDLMAIKEAANSGVVVLATAHCSSMEELERRLFFRQILDMGIMERIVFLSNSLGRGTVEKIFDGCKQPLIQQPFKL